MKVRDFCKIKGRSLITIGPNDTVSIAIKKLIENDIGALPVCNEKGMLLGIISERDLLKECFRHSSAIGSTKVQDVMTKKVAVGTLEDDLNYVANVMKQKKVRHLPIVVDQKVEDTISMRNIVHFQLEETTAQIRYIGMLPGTTRFGRRHLV